VTTPIEVPVTYPVFGSRVTVMPPAFVTLESLSYEKLAWWDWLTEPDWMRKELS
jgi:hypothetical protein